MIQKISEQSNMPSQPKILDIAIVGLGRMVSHHYLPLQVHLL